MGIHFLKSVLGFIVDVGGDAPAPLFIDQARDNEAGELVIGPGAGGLQPRPSEAKKALPRLTREQEELLAKAKRFAMEQSVQHVCCFFMPY